jgi:hypothetical protein
MRTLIALIFITTFLLITVLSAPAALDPNLMIFLSVKPQTKLTTT